MSQSAIHRAAWAGAGCGYARIVSSAERDSLPRQLARTRNFTLGAPRSFSISDDGRRVAFLRSKSGDDPVHDLWVLELDSGQERIVADARVLNQGAEADLPPEERARRERARESGEGIVSYATDNGLSGASFALGAALFVVDLDAGDARRLSTPGPVLDPRLDPTGNRVAFVSGGALWVATLEGEVIEIVGEGDPEITWGLPEFVAAEEMDRLRGFWWAPDGTGLIAARVDTSPVMRWHISDPTRPEAAPTRVAYPAAGTDNAIVSLAVFTVGGGRVDVDWDRESFPYLVNVVWDPGAPPLLLVQTRDQKQMLVLELDASSGATRTVRRLQDPAWVDVVPGVPARLADGRLVTVGVRNDAYALWFDDEPVSPEGLQVASVLHAGNRVVFSGYEEPTQLHLWQATTSGRVTRLTDDEGMHSGRANDDVVIVTSTSLESGPLTSVREDGRTIRVRSVAESPLLDPTVTLEVHGKRGLRTALLLPKGHDGGQLLPVLLDPYGGPGHARVVRSRNAFLESQWFAEQGFAVLVVDGRGTPGRGPAWDRAVYLDVAGPVLEDQVDALHEAAYVHPEMDLNRVAIRGWSFGGYLAALAVLRRPDVFHAASAGAPVTDERLYDTHYTERYLGHPDDNPELYRRNSLMDDAHKLERPLLLIHGLADDNVVVAHTLRFSRALLEAGRPHRVLPLSNITHMATNEVVAENLLMLELEFLREALSL
jgi:dipeptidyl-peptidase-4